VAVHRLAVVVHLVNSGINGGCAVVNTCCSCSVLMKMLGAKNSDGCSQHLYQWLAESDRKVDVRQPFRAMKVLMVSYMYVFHSRTWKFALFFYAILFFF